MGLISFFPVLLWKLSLVFLVTWVELARSAVSLNSRLAWKAVIWMVALLSLPLRLFTAIGRERQLEMEARYLQSALEAVAWERTYLRRRLKTMEHDHRNAVARIQVLEKQMRGGKKKRTSVGVAREKGENAKELAQSVFSAVMCMWVGTVMWEADQRCVPLLVALLAVVVVSFFSTLNSSNAAALFSFNCFILGAISYPTFPILASLGQTLFYNFLPFSSS